MTGAIVGSSLALGECMAFRFMVKPSGQCVTAQPPEDLTKKKTRRGPIKIRRRENWGLVEAEEAATSAEGDPVSLLLTPGIAATAHDGAFYSTCSAQPSVLCLKACCDAMCAAVHGSKSAIVGLQLLLIFLIAMVSGLLC